MDDEQLGSAIGVALSLGSEAPWIFQQPHGNEILELGGGAAFNAAANSVSVAGYDGAMGSAAQSGSPTLRATLVIKAADCVSILAVLPQHHGYAALHAGWRGTVAGILPRLLANWRARYGRLDKVRLAFGPHIRSCCFEVKEDCLAQFAERDLDGAILPREGRTYVSMEKVLRTQALAHGVTQAQIDAFPLCTQCYRDASGAFSFASYRRAQREGRPAGRNIAFIGPIR
jgi:copper oxidase (laccase) domain-containing protein